MPKITTGKVLLSATALWGGVGSFVFDWNETHIHNPSWPPHAKFHNAQTMSMGAALSGAALAAIWGKGDWSKGRLRVAAVAASMYWVTQLSASAYPGVAMADPPARISRKGPQTAVALSRWRSMPPRYSWSVADRVSEAAESDPPKPPRSHPRSARTDRRPGRSVLTHRWPACHAGAASRRAGRGAGRSSGPAG